MGPHRAPASPTEIEAALSRLGVRPERRFGQSFLADPFVADAEAALVGTAPGEPVLEIGGGLGILTEALLRKGIAPLTVLESDPRLAHHLERTFGPSIEVLEEDARTHGLSPYRAVVGNLPFSVATPVVLRLFTERVPRSIFMVQGEVADRLGASPGSRSYGRLSIAASLYGSVELFQKVGPESFVPPPKVGGRIVAFVARRGPLPVRSAASVENAVRVLFSSRRKQLGNLLPRLSSDPDGVARSAGWPSDWRTRRPENLPPEAFFHLANSLERTRSRGSAGRAGRPTGIATD